MFPNWIRPNLAIQWFRDGRWEQVSLEAKGERWIGRTSDQADISILLTEESTMESPNRSVYRLNVAATPNQDGQVAGIVLRMPLDDTLTCTWKPHLAPLDDMAIGDKAFRSPAIILENEQSMAALVPDLQEIEESRAIPYIMDYTLDGHSMSYGLCHYTETGHVYHRLTPAPTSTNGSVGFSCYLVRWDKEQRSSRRDYRPVERFIWEIFGKARMASGPLPDPQDLQGYVQHAYGWALDRWKDVCWQQFEIDGTEVGGVAFIVTSRQKPGEGQEQIWREPKSIWNQAWFCSLRTAYGYGWWGKTTGRPDWAEKADLALEFALSAPMTNGLFPGYYEAGPDQRWESGGWVMSGPRRPEGHDQHVHLLDSSWTCYWLLQWYRDLKKDPRILVYVRSYIDSLLKLQNADGSFPAWVNPQTLEASSYLQVSPETSVHAMLLCLYDDFDPDARFVEAALRAAAFVKDRIVPEGRWEDFETYWSCSKQWQGKQYGVRDARGGLYNQCNFGMYWTAEAFKSLYPKTGEARWLEAGETVLAEISLYQQVWQAPFLPVPTIGGFGVMNSDDEWNDARQSLFAQTYLDYYMLTKNETYLARGLWAMKASFYMMYCPENPTVKALYESVHPHFNERDYGFHMENFNHHDGTAVNGLGEFTIFDWGCGAASTSLAQVIMKLNPKESLV